MTAVSSGEVPPTVRLAHDTRRRSERRSCRLAVTLGTPGGDCSALLINISAEGVGLHVDTLLQLRPGMTLCLTAPAFGSVSLIVRWAMPPRYGAEFTAARHALAGVHGFYDSLPEAPGTVT